MTERLDHLRDFVDGKDTIISEFTPIWYYGRRERCGSISKFDF
jgi:hypothetical protein